MVVYFSSFLSTLLQPVMDHVLKTPHLPAPFTCFSRSSLFATTKFTIPTSQRKCFFDVGLILTTSWPTFFGSAFSKKTFSIFSSFLKFPVQPLHLLLCPGTRLVGTYFWLEFIIILLVCPAKKKFHSVWLFIGVLCVSSCFY